MPNFFNEAEIKEILFLYSKLCDGYLKARSNVSPVAK
jgi:hypothetical protein